MKKLYYISFNNCEGSFPQRDSESYSYDEVKEQVDKLNSQNDNPYCNYSVSYRVVE